MRREQIHINARLQANSKKKISDYINNIDEFNRLEERYYNLAIVWTLQALLYLFTKGIKTGNFSALM